MARAYRREGAKISVLVRGDLRARSDYAIVRGTALAKRRTRETVRAVGLGRLANAVDATTSAEKGKTRGEFGAWGAVFARGRADGRGNQALLAYSEGASIFPTGNRKWLAFATAAVPKRGPRNKKMTPDLYRASGLEKSIGKLQFVRGKRPQVAYLVARKVTVSRRTGRAKAFGGRTPRGSDRKDSIIAFVLIRYTRRAQRFDQGAIMADAAEAMAGFAAAYRPGTTARIA